ncbi:MAG: DsrE family protein [Hyphomicrobiaceae bacterium]|nr:MAG: DsrE family protein [Hyphomicrobiaceae bacterium]
MSKTAIVVFSDPTAGHEEALGRLFNAMFLTLELKDKGQDVALIFQGAGARWPAEVTKPAHPAHALYHAIADKVVGVCGGCADVFGATEGAKATGVTLVRDKQIPGTGGILDLSRYLDQGYRLVTF